MAVYKEKNGTYKVQFYKTNGKGEKVLTTKRGFPDKASAELFSALQKNNKGKFNIGDVTIETFVEMYFKDKRNLKEKSLKNKKNIIDKHILNVRNEDEITSLKGKKLRDITAKVIIDWQNAKIDEGYSDSYLLSIRKELSALLNHAEAVYHLKDNPSKGVPRMGSFDVGEVEFWTVDEFDQFIENISDQKDMYYVIWNVLFYSGMRLGELLALKPRCINFENLYIKISETYHRSNKEDVFTTTKTKAGSRTVYMPAFVMDMLKDYLYERPDIGQNDRVFPVVHKTVQNHLRKEINKTNMKYIHVHCLRHSHVAYLINLGYKIEVISKRVGHKDTTITTRIYGHLYNTDEKEVANGLQQKFIDRNNDVKKKEAV